ncbi:MAG: hypothetical protein KGH87_02200 [Thaumarchaeota archaeon]|nr:hypothetical protein [Nitrososphaerota archaeon]MDE1838710.1 hypothetical protein [Nitrososphaerota archaeon]
MFLTDYMFGSLQHARIMFNFTLLSTDMLESFKKQFTILPKYSDFGDPWPLEPVVIASYFPDLA